MPVDLGQMRKVAVRDVWKHEEQEFTPWLADDENFAKLAEALGMELQIEGIEVPVGPFSADILAKDTDSNFVVIENQFGKTNHDHLGKVLTYAATLNASEVVWIAERRRRSHTPRFHGSTGRLRSCQALQLLPRASQVVRPIIDPRIAATLDCELQTPRSARALM
jgi:hypothetical protein